MGTSIYGAVQAQLALGTVYNNIYKDYPKARFWYQKAADQGSYRGHYNLAVAYNNKESSMYDPAKAVEHLKVAAEGGDADARYWLGASYNPKAAEFWKVEKDIRKKKQAYAIGAHGVKLLEMALKNGNYKAAYVLYGVYAFGWGARVNEKLGREYLVMSARGGCEGAIEHCRKFNINY